MENNTLLAHRSQLVHKLAIFLDTANRDQLTVDDLLELQDAKSKTDRSAWRNLRKEAREKGAGDTASAREAVQVFKISSVSTPLRSPCEAAHDVSPSPTSISRRFMQQRTPERAACSSVLNISAVRIPVDCDGMLKSGVLPNSTPSPIADDSSDFEGDEGESGRRKKRAIRRRHRDDRMHNVLASTSSHDGSEGKQDTELSQMGTVPFQSPLVSDGSYSDDSSPQHVRMHRLEEELAKAKMEAQSWKERCGILESLLAASEAERARRRGAGGDVTPEREASHGGDQGWKVQQGTDDYGLTIGTNVLSSPVTRSLHKTLSEEATAIEAVTKALLEGNDEDIGDVGDLLYRITSLRRDLSVISDLTRGDRKENLVKISEQIGAYEDYIGSMQGEVKERMLGDKEDVYISAVTQQFQVVDIESDGNCLFAASSLGDHALSLLQWNESDEESATCEHVTNGWKGHGAIVGWVGDGDAAPSLEMTADAATETVRDLPKERRQEMAAGLRARVVQRLLDRGTGVYSDDITMSLREALESTRMDATSVALRAEAARRWGDVPITDVMLSSEEAVEVYSTVMSKEGVFGERLEISVISECVGRPLHVFYYDSSHKEGATVKPSEMFGQDLEGEPLCLLHMIQGNHFSLMRPKLQDKSSLPVQGPSGQGSATPRKKSGLLWRMLCA